MCIYIYIYIHICVTCTISSYQDCWIVVSWAFRLLDPCFGVFKVFRLWLIDGSFDGLPWKHHNFGGSFWPAWWSCLSDKSSPSVHRTRGWIAYGSHLKVYEAFVNLPHPKTKNHAKQAMKKSLTRSAPIGWWIQPLGRKYYQKVPRDTTFESQIRQEVVRKKMCFFFALSLKPFLKFQNVGTHRHPWDGSGKKTSPTFTYIYHKKQAFI